MEKKLIGKVAVDSGQLLIMDPCYIEREWKKDNESNILGVKVWGAGKDNAITYLQDKGYTVKRTEEGDGFIDINQPEKIQAIEKELVTFLQADLGMIVWNIVNDGSYQEVCKLTMSEERSGQFKEVIGCAFGSGFGDGQYEVYATYKDYGFGGMEDKRIAKVEIVLIED